MKAVLGYVKSFTKFAKIVSDYRRSFRHWRKGLWGATRGSVLGWESMLFGIGRRSGNVRAGMPDAGIGWIEVAILKLHIAGVWAQALIEA